MKDLVTYIAKTVANKFAHITDENEIFESEDVFESSKDTDDARARLEQKKKEAKRKRIKEIKTQIAVLQDELKKIEASDDSDSLEEVEEYAKRSAAAKKAAQTRKENQKWWDEYNKNTGNSTRMRYDYAGCGGYGYSSGGCY